jgi:hypothetical protein
MDLIDFLLTTTNDEWVKTRADQFASTKWDPDVDSPLNDGKCLRCTDGDCRCEIYLCNNNHIHCSDRIRLGINEKHAEPSPYRINDGLPKRARPYMIISSARRSTLSIFVPLRNASIRARLSPFSAIPGCSSYGFRNETCTWRSTPRHWLLSNVKRLENVRERWAWAVSSCQTSTWCMFRRPRRIVERNDFDRRFHHRVGSDTNIWRYCVMLIPMLDTRSDLDRKLQ